MRKAAWAATVHQLRCEEYEGREAATGGSREGAAKPSENGKVAPEMALSAYLNSRHSRRRSS